MLRPTKMQSAISSLALLPRYRLGFGPWRPKVSERRQPGDTTKPSSKPWQVLLGNSTIGNGNNIHRRLSGCPASNSKIQWFIVFQEFYVKFTHSTIKSLSSVIIILPYFHMFIYHWSRFTELLGIPQSQKQTSQPTRRPPPQVSVASHQREVRHEAATLRSHCGHGCSSGTERKPGKHMGKGADASHVGISRKYII